MLIRSEFQIDFELPSPVAIVALLRLHPSLATAMRSPEVLTAAQGEELSPLATTEYTDSFGNHCTRFVAPAGKLRLAGSNLVERESFADETPAGDVGQHQIEDLPTEVLQFLLASRYCQVDSFSLVAGDLFGATAPGWTRALAIRDWVHDHVRFDYASARPQKTALDVFTERVGVCRDFQHLAITLSRAMNIPARYATGYLGDIRRPSGGPGDFSAWYEVFLDGRWWTLDARHNDGREGRVLMATGRDATDVALTTSFGIANLKSFYVDSSEVDGAGIKVPPPVSA